MKRFFCVTCKSVKRVRTLPLEINDIYSNIPSDRIGRCDWHTSGVINGRAVTPKQVNYKKTKASTVQTKQKKAS